ncbi:efflux RND transporter periplasmic adaptor subunit [Aliikangiella coralliicola]|uniref:HlyD family efflux transporter periplasmic adaptor subunit n=1 Tax=Aliikangiella coralliicola TaxID=2592383 RepID=A0A545UDY8_9GAMM|nr:HlyD family efflux transporter periplasmic adaptor subunit [Aliikangiella coralliicola]TQV87676.1 HlyD family efflux transporter periplasmic adaptor subunit [Aliikangiella coralliicola]
MSDSPNVTSQPVTRKKFKLRTVFIPLGIVFGGFLVMVIAGGMAPKPAKKPVETKAPLVEAIEAIKGDVVFEIESQGSIMPRTETTMVSEVSGVIKNVSSKFVVGGFFEKGELLLEIDPISYEVALLQAQARLDAANARLVEERARGKQAEKEWSMTGRAKNNAPILALRKPQLQQAEADVKAAQADVRNAQIKLDRTRIVAPYDAMVKAKMVDIGQYVSTGSQLATTFAIDYAEIRLPIKEQDFAFIEMPALGAADQVGAKVELSWTQGGKRKTLDSFITRSEGVVDANSRVNYVVAQINDPYGVIKSHDKAEKGAGEDAGNKVEPIRVGTFVKAKIYGTTVSDVVSVPRKAVRGSNELYLVNDDRRLKFSKVNILRTDAENIYVSDGLSSGDKVVVTKLSTPVEGMSIRLSGYEESIESEESENSQVASQSDAQTSEEETLVDNGGGQ